MNRKVAVFLARLVSNKYRNLFLTRLGTYAFLAKFGIVGRTADFIGFFIRGIIGLMIESGVFLLDLTLDAYREGQKTEEFKEMATKAYQKATAKIYSEEEKNEIRKEYLQIISKFGAVGSPK